MNNKPPEYLPYIENGSPVSINALWSQVQEIVTWIKKHEELTLPRFKKELIELFQDEDVRKAIMEIPRYVSVTPVQPSDLASPAYLHKQVELQAVEKELGETSEVVDIDKNKPMWLSGMAACLHCAYHWQAVLRHETLNKFLECNQCGQMKGLVLNVNKE